MSIRKRVLTIVALLLPLVIFPGCKGEKGGGEGKPVLSVSVAPQKYLLDALAGELYDVNVLIPGNADPETYDPSMQTLSRLGESEAFFAVGAGGFEKPTLDKIRSNFPDLKVIDTTSGASLIKGTHSPEGFDPHVWGSVRIAKGMAGNMYRTLCELDAAHEAVFTRNYRRLISSLDSLDNEVSGILEGGDRSFVIWHPSLSYFARDYGLRQLSLEQDGKESSPQQFRRRLDAIGESGARVMFVEAVHGTDKSSSVAKEKGLTTVTINLGSEDWPSEIRRLALSLNPSSGAK